FRDLGYVNIGEESFEVTPGKKTRSLRFEPKKGAGAPLEDAPLPLRVVEDGDPVASGKTIEPAAFAPTVAAIKAGQVPTLAELPAPKSTHKAHNTPEKIAADPILQGELKPLTTKFTGELGGELSINPPETDLNGKIAKVANAKDDGGELVYQRKGPKLDA